MSKTKQGKLEEGSETDNYRINRCGLMNPVWLL